MRRITLWITLALFAAVIGPTASAETGGIGDVLKAQGYVSVPITRRSDTRYYVEGMVHGQKLTFMLDLSNDGSLYDIRALKKLDIDFEKTEIVIPTKRKNVRIHTARILGVEFGGKSTGSILIHAGDVDPIYNVKPGTDGPDGVLGAEFLAQYGALLDFDNQSLYLKIP